MSKPRVGVAENGLIETTGPDVQARIRRMTRAILEADPGRSLTPEERERVAHELSPPKVQRCARHDKFGCRLCGAWKAGGYPHKLGKRKR